MLKMTDILNVASHAGRDVGRYAVNGVLVDVGGTIVATDARRMARITPAKTDPQFQTAKILNLAVLKATLPKEAALTWVNGDVRAAVVVPRDADEALVEHEVPNSIPAKKGVGREYLEIVGDFPDHKKIVPTDGFREDFEIELNPDFVADAMMGAARFLTEHNGKNCDAHGVTFHFRDVQSAVVFRAVAEDGAVYESLVMPITRS